MKRASGWMILAAAAVLLSGCNAGERGKAVRFDKGGYKGPMDAELSDSTRKALSDRVSLQGFGGGLQQPFSPVSWPATTAEVEGRIAGQRF